MEQKEDFRYLVRIANTDLNGSTQIGQALTKIKGISFMFSNMVCYLAHIDKSQKVGSLNDDQIKKLDEIIQNPKQYGAPDWMFNRRFDPEDGVSKHLLTSNLTFIQDNDIKTMKKIRSYKGIRHMLGLPVRGQRTRSNFRKNKGKVHLGVQKKAAAQKPAEGKEKKK